METAVTDYTLVAGDSDTNLIDAVKASISKGWRPLGAPFAVVSADGKHLFMQALVR
jgi:hypothetical protein